MWLPPSSDIWMRGNGIAGRDVLAALEEARALEVGHVTVAVGEDRQVGHAVGRAALVVHRRERDDAAQRGSAGRAPGRSRFQSMKLVTASPPREWPIRPMREKSSLPTSAPPMFVFSPSGIAAGVRVVERVEHRGDDHPALVHALAEIAVLVVHELVLVDRRDRVAPAREVLTEVGVAAVVALERRAVRCRAAVAAAVVAVHEHDHGRAGRAVGGVVDRAAQLHA